MSRHTTSKALRRANRRRQRQDDQRRDHTDLIYLVEPLVGAIVEVVGDDAEAVDQAREDGRTIIRAVLGGL